MDNLPVKQLQLPSKGESISQSIDIIQKVANSGNRMAVKNVNLGKNITNIEPAIQRVKTPYGSPIDLEDSSEGVLYLTKSFESYHIASNEKEAEECAKNRYKAENAVGSNTTAPFWDWAYAIMAADKTLALGDNMITVNLSYIDMGIVAGTSGIKTMNATNKTGDKVIGVKLDKRDSPDYQSIIWELTLFHVH